MSTITALVGTDGITTANSMAKINTNFTNLNTDKMETSVLDTDTTLAANSDAKVATQKAVKTYVDAGGNVNASETAKGISQEATDAQVTAGTATGSTSAKLFVTPTKLKTYLKGLPSLSRMMNTTFETAGRFTAILDSGTNTFGAAGVFIDTTVTTTRAAGFTWAIGNNTVANIFAGSPVFTTSFSITTLGTTGSSFFGLGTVTKSGTGHTYTTDHCGFKVLIVGSVASLYATQGDGVTETASSALTTIAADDQIDLILKMNSNTSIDYYYQKNGGGWSTATTLTTNIPDTADRIMQFSVSNNSTATRQEIDLISASYAR